MDPAISLSLFAEFVRDRGLYASDALVLDHLAACVHGCPLTEGHQGPGCAAFDV
jgi:hypothetical protein